MMTLGRRHSRLVPAIAAVCLLAASAGADPAGEVKAEGNPGPLALFDGKSLDGWKATGFRGGGEVKVEGGAIVLPAGRPMSGVTCTRKDLPTTNYELSYEAMRRSGTDFFAAATFPVGTSFVTLVNGGWGGNVTGLSSLDGADASENETTRFLPYKDKTWYRFRVRVTARRVRCRVDDAEVIVVDHAGRQVATRIETRGCQPLGFATYETSGAVRKVEVRALSPAEVRACDAED